MIQKKFKKSYAIGIISIFIIISIALSNINADSPGKIEVQFFKWNGTQIIEEITDVSTGSFNTFQDECESCEDAEEVYAVFQDYGLTPQDKTYDDFIEWAENEYKNNTEMQEYVENNSMPQEDLYFQGCGVFDTGTINAPFTCEKTIFSNYYIDTYTFAGGILSYVSLIPPDADHWEESDFFETLRLFYIGGYWPPVHNGENIIPRNFLILGSVYSEFTMEISE